MKRKLKTLHRCVKSVNFFLISNKLKTPTLTLQLFGWLWSFEIQIAADHNNSSILERWTGKVGTEALKQMHITFTVLGAEPWITNLLESHRVSETRRVNVTGWWKFLSSSSKTCFHNHTLSTTRHCWSNRVEMHNNPPFWFNLAHNKQCKTVLDNYMRKWEMSIPSTARPKGLCSCLFLQNKSNPWAILNVSKMY